MATMVATLRALISTNDKRLDDISRRLDAIEGPCSASKAGWAGSSGSACTGIEGLAVISPPAVQAPQI